MNRTHLIGLVAVIALALGVGMAIRQFAPAQRPGAGEALTTEDPSSDVIAEAMRKAPATAPIDSAEIKARWQEEVRGVDLQGLDERQLEIFLRFANSQACTCGCGYTLAGCKASDMSCEVSGSRLESLLDSVRTGRIRTAVGVRERPQHGS